MGQHGTVATRLHHLQELGYATDLDIRAHYVIQPDVVDAVFSNSARLCHAMAQARAMRRIRMSHPSVLVEVVFGRTRCLTHLRWDAEAMVANARVYGLGEFAGKAVRSCTTWLLFRGASWSLAHLLLVPRPCRGVSQPTRS